MTITGTDTIHDQRLRKKLMEAVKSKGIADEKVLLALETIPRHFFIDESNRDSAYADKPVPIGEGQTISQPYTVAYQTQLLKVSSSDKILEIGTGSAYQACILALIGKAVFTIERQKKLFVKYQRSPYLETFDNLHFFYGDGNEGLPGMAPFDRILITAATPSVPPALVEQLKSGGCLVLPLGSVEQSQRMVRITKLTDGGIKEETFDKFRFVPMLEGTHE